MSDNAWWMNICGLLYCEGILIPILLTKLTNNTLLYYTMDPLWYSTGTHTLNRPHVVKVALLLYNTIYTYIKNHPNPPSGVIRYFNDIQCYWCVPVTGVCVSDINLSGGVMSG